MLQSVASQHTVDTQFSGTNLNNEGHHFSHSVASWPIVHPHSKRVGINLKRAVPWSRPWMQGVRDTLGIHPDGGWKMFENGHQRGWYSTMWNTFASDAVNTCEDIAWIIGSSGFWPHTYFWESFVSQSHAEARRAIGKNMPKSLDARAGWTSGPRVGWRHIFASTSHRLKEVACWSSAEILWLWVGWPQECVVNPTKRWIVAVVLGCLENNVFYNNKEPKIATARPGWRGCLRNDMFVGNCPSSEPWKFWLLGCQLHASTMWSWVPEPLRRDWSTILSSLIKQGCMLSDNQTWLAGKAAM